MFLACISDAGEEFSLSYRQCFSPEKERRLIHELSIDIHFAFAPPPVLSLADMQEKTFISSAELSICIFLFFSLLNLKLAFFLWGFLKLIHVMTFHSIQDFPCITSRLHS